MLAWDKWVRWSFWGEVLSLMCICVFRVASAVGSCTERPAYLSVVVMLIFSLLNACCLWAWRRAVKKKKETAA